MTLAWRRELRLIFVCLFAAGGIGYWLHQLGYALAITLFVFLAWNMWQSLRIVRWFQQPDMQSLPESIGLWGRIFYETRRLQKRSLTHQQRLKGIINRIQDSTAALQDAVLMVDRHGNLEWWNQTAERFLGLKAPVDVNQPITNLIRNPEFHRYFTDIDYEEPLTIPSPARRGMHLEFNITLFGRNDRLIVVHDVTRLVNLEQMRKDFVANVSHELRTPLTVLSGYIETMDMQADMLPPRWGRMLSQMSQQSQRMEHLIRDLLTLSRLETAQHEPPKLVAIPGLLSSIINDAKAVSSERGHQITLSIETEYSPLGYHDELRSAFSNLVVNAVKYTPDNGHVDVRWYEQDGFVCLAVIDDGMGIADHHIPRLTERFYRADPSRNQATGGTGLGLAIVKHVLLRHDGDLVIESQVGKGSTFCARIPLHRCRLATSECNASAATSAL
ncbi:phosphate regulon sensor histidine kinase PhoR [Thalassolituus oleivorans]|uniref:phosphate regulon sensor histidine kinase PhoR n=1 Tax=Thalassolituus oleivorans TaxID=187493 RepID=UPI00240A2D8A|nr:phosphate regulon sensor histidine kinase PhoR [Thalassolituus oleivorans]MDF1639366.1 phosphate regulon sensor histidine kinase PhoR [Thalassolituus oleivorans]